MINHLFLFLLQKNAKISGSNNVDPGHFGSDRWGEYMKENFSERSSEWIDDDKTFVCRERQLSKDKISFIKDNSRVLYVCPNCFYNNYKMLKFVRYKSNIASKKSMFKIISSSNIPDADKWFILNDLQQVESLKQRMSEIKERMAEIKERMTEALKSSENEKQLQKERMAEVLKSSEKEKELQEKLLAEVINNREKLLAEIKERMAEVINSREKETSNLSNRLAEETAYKLHYQQLLTVRAIIEVYEKNFGGPLTKKNVSRLEKWETFLASSDAIYKPFKEAGFTIEQVCSNVDLIYKTHSADIHSFEAVEGLILKARGKLTEDQVKIMKVIVEQSPWKNLISVE